MTFHAVLIDPERKVVEDVQIEEKDHDHGLAHIAQIIGTSELGHMTLTRHVGGWHDDIGLLRGPWETLHFFRCSWYPTALTGKHLLIGITWKRNKKEGYDEDFLGDLAWTAAEIALQVHWVTPQSVVVPAPTINGELIMGGDSNGNWTFKDQPPK